MKTITPILLACILSLSACGGGSSGSGASREEGNVTQCLAHSSVKGPDFGQNNTFTNSCNYAVNVGYTQLASVLTLEIPANKQIKEDSSFPIGVFIGCKAPSRPFDSNEKDADNNSANITLSCT